MSPGQGVPAAGHIRVAPGSGGEASRAQHRLGRRALSNEAKHRCSPIKHSLPCCLHPGQHVSTEELQREQKAPQMVMAFSKSWSFPKTHREHQCCGGEGSRSQSVEPWPGAAAPPGCQEGCRLLLQLAGSTDLPGTPTGTGLRCWEWRQDQFLPLTGSDETKKVRFATATVKKKKKFPKLPKAG